MTSTIRNVVLGQNLMGLFSMGMGTFCQGQILWLMWEHQGFWKSDVFGEFLKFIKVFEWKVLFFKTFVFSGLRSICLHLLWNLKNGVYLIDVQALRQSLNLLAGCLLYFCFKYTNDWLRIHKLHECKQFQIMFGKQLILYV